MKTDKQDHFEAPSVSAELKRLFQTIPRATLLVVGAVTGVLLAASALLVAAGVQASLLAAAVYWLAALMLIVVAIWGVRFGGSLVSSRRFLERALHRRSIMEQGLRANEELYRAAMATIPDSLLLVFDQDLRFILAEGGGLVLIKQKTDDLVGHTLQDVFPELVSEMVPAMQAALQGEPRRLEVSVHDRIMQVRILLLKQSGSRRAGLIVAHDVTLERRSAREASESRRQIRRLISNIPGMVFRSNHDEHRKIEYVSEGCEELTGYRPEDVGKELLTWADLVHPDDWDAVMSTAELNRKEGRPFELRYRLVTRSGEIKWVAGRGAFVQAADGSWVVEGIVVDITAQRQAEQEALEREKQLMQAGRLASIGTLVTGVAHEINTPNAVISLNAPMLGVMWQDARPVLEEAFAAGQLQSLGGMPWENVRNEVGPMLEKIVSSSRRIRSIVSDLKDFGRHSGGDAFSVVNLEEVVRAAADLVETAIRRSTDHFTIYPPQKPVLVMGRFQRLEQVVVNALINSCDALTSKDSALEVRFVHTDGWVELQVHDEGEGMDAEAVSRAMEPFFTTKHDSGGVGLGLAISQSIVEKHGGTLTIESRLGHGTVCRVLLPAAPEAEVELAPEENEG